MIVLSKMAAGVGLTGSLQYGRRRARGCRQTQPFGLADVASLGAWSACQVRPGAMTFTLRLPEESDREFLYELHRTTMREVIEETWGWDESWQRQDFDRRLAEDIAWIIEVDREKAGGLWLDWQRDALDIQELQICPAYQGRGLGTAVIPPSDRAGRRVRTSSDAFGRPCQSSRPAALRAPRV